MRHLPFAILLAILILPSRTVLAGDNGWDWEFSPYVWATSVYTELNEDEAPTGNETRFLDLVPKLQFAFMGHLEGQGDDFGVMLDVIGIMLDDEASRKRIDIETELNSMVIEFAGVWSPGEKRYRGFEALAGVRNIWIDSKFTIDPDNPAFDTAEVELDDWKTDVLIGARYSGDISSKWGYSLRADGSWGGTEGTYSGAVLFKYRLSNGHWNIGYRYLYTDFKVGPSELNVQLYGPILGYTFKF